MGIVITREEGRARQQRENKEYTNGQARNPQSTLTRSFRKFLSFLKCDGFRAAWAAKAQGEQLNVDKDLGYMGEDTIGNVLVELSIINKPLHHKCKPLLNRLRDVVQGAVDELLESRAAINQLANNITHINHWASDRLGRVKKADSSVENTFRRTFGPIIGVQSNLTERACLQELLLMTSTTKKLVSDLALTFPSQANTFGMLRIILDDITLVIFKDKAKLDSNRLKEEAYWQSLFRSYNQENSQREPRGEDGEHSEGSGAETNTLHNEKMGNLQKLTKPSREAQEKSNTERKKNWDLKW
ncbi:uncharacterized protein PAC_15337 [Phialocephala subalpina]|uniref:Uncharacterized protein n=1 Tax=Phialocephala subalpina TaxID=576137 RepID=A0A1L7XKG8_9HELO|nr:uncharacterized protein PAC_15337 [Phialocephala subalpina]